MVKRCGNTEKQAVIDARVKPDAVGMESFAEKLYLGRTLEDRRYRRRDMAALPAVCFFHPLCYF